jgi:hypothetical protein
VQFLLQRQGAKYNDEELNMLRVNYRTILKLESALNVFKDDHKIFKGKFIFSGKDQYIEVPKMQE